MYTTMPLEADTRFLIDTALTNLGWHFNGKDKNVFLEQPKTEAERKKLGGKRPDYVLYAKESDKPLIIIETKRHQIRFCLTTGNRIRKNFGRTLSICYGRRFLQNISYEGKQSPFVKRRRNR